MLRILKAYKNKFVWKMGSKIVLEFDPVNNMYSFLENIAIVSNVYSSILIIFFNKTMTRCSRKECKPYGIKGGHMTP